MLTDRDRKRHAHIVEKGNVIGFVVQYEIFFEERWVPIIRYDTSHGYAHKDLINPDGSKEKIFMGAVEFSEALTSLKNWD